MSKFKLTEIQATAILDMQLRRLARLEREKIEEEYAQISKSIEELEGILTHPRRILDVIAKEVTELSTTFGDMRRTKIYQTKLGEFSQEDLVAKEETLIALTSGGYIKRSQLGAYRQQARGGKGAIGMTTKEEDEIAHLTIASTHDQLLIFTDRGRVLAVPVWEIPEGSRISKGQAIVNFVNLEGGERVQTILPLTKDTGFKYLFMATKHGVVKKTPVAEFANIRGRGIVAIKLESDDELVWVRPTTGENDILMLSRAGKAIKFSEKDVRPLGRATMGVRGIKLNKGDTLVGMEVVERRSREARKRDFCDILIVTERGIGKRTPVELFPLQKRSGIGVKALTVTPRTGELTCAILVTEDDDQAVLTSRAGQVIKLPIRGIPQLSRVAQGVILMRMREAGNRVAAVTTVPKDTN